MPPAQTGVADYAAALLDGLRALGEVELEAKSGIPLYHVGNNLFHAEIYQRALDHPGAVILHDGVLQHLMVRMLDREAYVDEFVYNYGDWYRGYAEDLWEKQGTAGTESAYFEYPMIRRLAERSRLILVHNSAAAAMVRQHAPQTRVETVPHLFRRPNVIAEADVPSGGPLFGIFGYLREPKRLHVVLNAMERVPGARLLVAGRFVSPQYATALEPLLQSDRVVRLPLGTEAELEGRLLAADVCVNLRWPSAAETSGITIRAMGAGKPVMVTDGPETADLPDSACVKVEAGASEQRSLEAMMCWLAQSRSDREAIGRNAQRHIETHHALEIVSKRIWPLLQTLVILCLACFPARSESKSDFKVAMRDGVRLATSVYLPGTERYPAILVRTPYNKGAQLPPNYQYFVDSGYAFVLQDVRGRYLSEGVFRPLTQEVPDGEDTLRWIAAQRWCNGRIAMMGGSYSGLVQWKAALANVPALKALFVVHGGSDEYFDRFYAPGGAFRLGHRMLWLAQNLRAAGSREPAFAKYVEHIPLRTMDRAATGHRLELLQLALDHPTYDAFWQGISVRQQLSKVNVPTFALSGWYDPNVQSDLETIAALRAQGTPARIAVGPWGHNMSVPFPGIDFGPNWALPIRTLISDWFARWLKDVPAEPEGGPVSLFVMGANRWREEAEWPLKRAVALKYYLGAQDRLTAAPGADAMEEYTYDPRRPVPTKGGAACCDPKIFPWGPMDQRPVEDRPDVLGYVTEPLTEPVEVTGPVKAQIYVSTSALDTDFTVKLVDVFPSGEARLLTDGILRLRYREGLGRPVLARPGEVYSVTVDAGVTSNVFLPGHRIRVDVSSSNFPKYDRNLNTGGPVADERQVVIAHQKVLFGKRYPSHLRLPVVPSK